MHLFRAGIVSVVGGLAISFDLLHLAGLSSLRQVSSPVEVLEGIQGKLGLNVDTAVFGLVLSLTLLSLFRELVYDEPYPEIVIPPIATESDPDIKSGPKPKKRICLVTGAAGFTGRCLVEELLARGHYDVIKALDMVTPSFQDPRVINIKANILEQALLLKELTDVEAVFHVASMVTLRSSPSAQYRLRQVNVLGCRHVVDSCVRRGVKRLVYTSSVATVSDGKSGLIFGSEEEAGRRVKIPNTWYGITKKAAEEQVLRADGVGGLRTAAVKPFMIYGEGDNYSLRSAVEGNPMVSSDTMMSAVYSRNLAEWEILADRALEERPGLVGGQSYFVADDGSRERTRDGFNHLLITALRLRQPSFLKNWLLRIFSFIVPPLEWFTNGRYSGDVWELCPPGLDFALLPNYFSIEKGLRHLGYQRRYSDQQIVENIRSFYKISE